MRLSGRDEQKRAWPHGPPGGTIEEGAGTGNYDLGLVAGVGGLRIGAPRRIELDAQCAVAKEFEETQLCPALEFSLGKPRMALSRQGLGDEKAGQRCDRQQAGTRAGGLETIRDRHRGFRDL